MRSASVVRFVKRLPSSGVGLLDCWPLGGSLNRDGYARFGNRAECPELYAHRVVWHEVFGPIPAGLEVDHLCFRRDCVNPLHLRVCSVAENRAARRPPASYKTHCPKGHPYAGKNLYVNPRNRTRHCRECIRQATRRWYDRKVRGTGNPAA